MNLLFVVVKYICNVFFFQAEQHLAGLSMQDYRPVSTVILYVPLLILENSIYVLVIVTTIHSGHGSFSISM